MIRVSCLVPAVVFAAVPVFAQGGGQGAPQKITLVTTLQRGYAAVKTNLTQEADKMPEADYGFKPSSMPEVRPFSSLFGHVANAQFATCAVLKGVPNPNQGNNLEQKTAKADVVKALADSFAFCDDAYSSLTTDDNLLQMIKQGQNEVTRAAALMGLIVHGNEMYGTGAVYLRAKGIVPPTTERMQGRGRGGE